MMALLLAMADSACAQARPTRMVPGPSVRELVPESPKEKENRISQIIFAQLFKPGDTTYTHPGASALKNAPPLPTGCTLFKDLVYEIKTQAIMTEGFNVTVFTLPSVDSEQDFKSLAILHLKYDELSPLDKTWEAVTLYSPPQDESIFHFIPKTKYDSLQPDFKLRQLAAVTGQFGIFAIAMAPDSEPARREPFPEVTVNATSSPEPARVGQEVTHTITFTNKGTSAAAEINVKEVLQMDLDYVSATPSQGVCKQKIAGNNIVCHLGVLPGGATATIKLVSRARNSFVKDIFGKTDSSKVVSNTLEVVFKQSATDFVDERGQIFTEVKTTIVIEP
jgi:uncharacterized repeat protein (TIGR01451 family)